MSGEKSKYVLDSFAILAYLTEEEGADVVEDLLNKAKNGEVQRVLCRCFCCRYGNNGRSNNSYWRSGIQEYRHASFMDSTTLKHSIGLRLSTTQHK